MPRLIQIGISVLAIASMSLLPVPGSDAIFAQPGKKTTRRGGQPTAREPSSPAATLPQVDKPKAPTAPDLGADDDKLPAPFSLPVASRARIRACGEAWQDLKMSGRTGGQTWRGYATKCLAKDGPGKPSP